jgi:SAM-dependent methyltransferase
MGRDLSRIASSSTPDSTTDAAPARSEPTGLALERLATFLYAEWGDVFFPKEPPDPLCGRFYRTIARLVAVSAGPGDLPRVCDVGGGLGRFLYELDRYGLGHTELVLVEPAGPLCEWARHLLCGTPFPGLVPVVTRAETVEFRRMHSAQLPAPIPSAVVHETTVAGLGCPDGHFDLVGCLNVVDRVPRPARLVAGLSRMLRPGGVLVLSSPFQFRAELTAPEHRLTDLRDVLPPDAWTIRHETPRLPYEFRTYERGYLRFDSQVVVAVKR